MIKAKIDRSYINLCDMPFKAILQSSTTGYDGCYIGSYICGNYFIELLKRLLSSTPQNKYTLVIPVLSESQYYATEKLLKKCYEEKCLNFVDSVVVNDLGGIQLRELYFKHCNLFLGRIFFREYRDFRYSDFTRSPQKTKISQTAKIIRSLYSEIDGYEIECSGKKIILDEAQNDMEIFVHTPFALMTYGHICEFSSINKEPTKKFRPDDKCSLECFGHQIDWIVHGLRYCKSGRGIYCEIPFDAEIFELPVSLIVKKTEEYSEYENTCPFGKI